MRKKTAANYSDMRWLLACLLFFVLGCMMLALQAYLNYAAQASTHVRTVQTQPQDVPSRPSAAPIPKPQPGPTTSLPHPAPQPVAVTPAAPQWPRKLNFSQRMYESELHATIERYKARRYYPREIDGGTDGVHPPVYAAKFLPFPETEFDFAYGIPETEGEYQTVKAEMQRKHFIGIYALNFGEIGTVDIYVSKWNL